MEKRNYNVLNNSTINKSVAFTKEEREQFGLRGLLPYSIASQDIQVNRIMNSIRRKACDIDKYILLSLLHDRNERLFYRVVADNVEEIMPIIYTPTVGQACKEFSHNFKIARGFYITPEDREGVYNIYLLV